MSLLRQALRFLVVGAIGTGMDGALFGALILGGTDPRIANMFSYSSSAVLGFWLHRSWTFGAREERPGKQAVRFAAMVGAGLLVSTGIVWLLAPRFGPLPAKLAAICATLTLNFTISRWLVFSGRPRFRSSQQSTADIAENEDLPIDGSVSGMHHDSQLRSTPDASRAISGVV